MKQAVMIAPGKIEFCQVEKPALNDGEVLMQTKRIGVCGSDIHVYHGMHPYTGYPVIQGHEVSGIVAAIGKNVPGIEVGSKMTFTPQITCGDCYPCRHNQYHICENLKVMGFQTDGAAQEFVVLPAWNVFTLPDDMPLDFAAMIEPIAVGIHAVRKGGDVTGKNVIVLGAGTIGNLTAQVAKALGAASVMITDVQDYKLEKAKACHIDHAINTTREKLGDVISREFGPDRADVMLECVGVQATVTQAIENARKGSTIVIVGVFGEKPLVDLGLVQDRELNLVGTLMYQKRDYEDAIALVSSGKLHLDELVTHRFAFDDYTEAYQAIENANGEYMKVMIDLD